MENPKLYTCAEVANIFGVTTQTIYDWIKAERIRATKLGKEYRISAAAVAELLKTD